jgi:hypothetical protein
MLVGEGDFIRKSLCKSLFLNPDGAKLTTLQPTTISVKENNNLNMHIMAAQLKADLVLLTVSFKQHGLQ